MRATAANTTPIAPALSPTTSAGSAAPGPSQPAKTTISGHTAPFASSTDDPAPTVKHRSNRKQSSTVA